MIVLSKHQSDAAVAQPPGSPAEEVPLLPPRSEVQHSRPEDPGGRATASDRPSRMTAHTGPVQPGESGCVGNGKIAEFGCCAVDLNQQEPIRSGDQNSLGLVR